MNLNLPLAHRKFILGRNRIRNFPLNRSESSTLGIYFVLSIYTYVNFNKIWQEKLVRGLRAQTIIAQHTSECFSLIKISLNYLKLLKHGFRAQPLTAQPWPMASAHDLIRSVQSIIYTHREYGVFGIQKLLSYSSAYCINIK